MRTQLLAALKEADDYISGQELCEHFGVSRTAIWKAVKQLKEAGYVIEAVQNKGYKIVSTPDCLTSDWNAGCCGKTGSRPRPPWKRI